MKRFSWPDHYECAVALTFDLDGETYPFAIDPTTAYRRLTMLSEGMYGTDVGMHYILELLDRYGLPATFFVPGFTAELHVDVVREIATRGHELGHHGYLHEKPDDIPDDVEERVILKGLDVLEKITGERPIGYRSPSWAIKPSTPALLRKYEFLYDTSLMNDEVPFTIPTSEGPLVELPVQWGLDDWPHFGFPGGSLATPRSVLESWTKEFEGLYDRGGCYVLTMHPELMGRPARLKMLEDLVRYIRGYPHVWFATMREIASDCLERGVCAEKSFPAVMLFPQDHMPDQLDAAPSGNLEISSALDETERRVSERVTK